MMLPQARGSRFSLCPGVVALPSGLLLLESSATLVAADAHFAYEDVIGGALPLWSTREIVALLLQSIQVHSARELVLLGDIIHGTIMSDGAAATVAGALDALREACAVTLIAGNHEGKSRGMRILGETFEVVDRDGWSLVHGDRDVHVHARAIVGHLHPSLSLGGTQSIRAFLAADRAIVVPALNPYSRGLDVLSSACARALGAFGPVGNEYSVVASDDEHVYPFGSLPQLRAALRKGAARRPAFPRYRRRLHPD